MLQLGAVTTTAAAAVLVGGSEELILENIVRSTTAVVDVSSVVRFTRDADEKGLVCTRA